MRWNFFLIVYRTTLICNNTNYFLSSFFFYTIMFSSLLYTLISRCQSSDLGRRHNFFYVRSEDTSLRNEKQALLPTHRKYWVDLAALPKMTEPRCCCELDVIFICFIAKQELRNGQKFNALVIACFVLEIWYPTIESWQNIKIDEITLACFQFNIYPKYFN